jgi:quinol monooxygenase YgiN
MSKTLSIIAKVVVKTDKLELVKSELLKLVDATLLEEGCLNYDLHQDVDNPNVFMFYENWTDYDSWEQHMNSQNLDAYKKATEGCIKDLTLNKMVKL